MEQAEGSKIFQLWIKLRQLLVFLLKLTLDGIRDVVLFPFAITATLLDSILDKQGDESYFEKLMVFGRTTEHAINLFQQHKAAQDEPKGIDAFIDHMEGRLRKEVQHGNLSNKARETVEETLKKLRSAGLERIPKRAHRASYVNPKADLQSGDEDQADKIAN